MKTYLNQFIPLFGEKILTLSGGKENTKISLLKMDEQIESLHSNKHNSFIQIWNIENSVVFQRGLNDLRFDTLCAT